MRHAREANGRSVAQFTLPGVGTPAQLSLCPNAEDWRQYIVPGEAHLEALIVDGRNRAARGEDPGALFHRLTRAERRKFVARLAREGTALVPDGDLVEAWREYTGAQ